MPTFSEFIRNTDPEVKRRIYEEAMRAATERQNKLLAEAKRRTAEHDSEHGEVNFDLDRMKRAVEGPFITVPEGLTREQFCDWMSEQCKKLK